MERTEAVRMPKIVGFSCAVFTAVLFLFIAGCGKNPGHVRANQAELIGSYEAKFRAGVERLELKSDDTYVQTFASEKKPINHAGRWKLENPFLDGSDVVLISAVVSEDDPEGAAERSGDRILNVYRGSGGLALAINETADWYFVRIQ